jgi:hypothetical protein
MKNLLLSVVLAITMTSCIASKARENALLPAMNLAWPGVHADIERGVADAQLPDRSMVDFEIVKIEVALDSGLAADFRVVSWGVLEPFGQRGINDRIADGEMSEMVAESLRERLRNFGVGLSKMSAVAYRHPAPTDKSVWLSDGTQVTNGRAVFVDGTSQPLTITN